MSLSYLKVKIKSLTAEARIVRHEERKILGSARWYRRRDFETQANTPSAEQESCYIDYQGLHCHRTENIRRETRSALLAYSYLHGRMFKSTENMLMKKPPSWSRIVALVKKYDSLCRTKEEVQRDLAMWLEEANLPNKFLPHFCKF